MTTTSPARKIKSALTKAFSGVKFSVTTSTMFVNVYWTVEIGSAATRDAVEAVAKPFESAVTTGDSIDDSLYTRGYVVDLRPQTSPEREEWAIQQVETKFNAEYCKDYCSFKMTDGRCVDSSEFHYYLWNAPANQPKFPFN